MSYPRAIESPDADRKPPGVDEIVCRVVRETPELVGDFLAVLARRPELLHSCRQREPNAWRLARLQDVPGAREIVREYLDERRRRRKLAAAARAGLLPGGIDGEADY